MSARVAPQGSLIQTHRGHARVLPVASAGTGGSAYSTVVLAEASLVSYWRLNEPSGTTATDSKGANPGTYTGGVTLNQAGAVTGGKSVLLDGTTGFITVPDAASLRITGDLTLEAWVHPTDYANFAGLISKRTDSAHFDPFASYLNQTTGVVEFQDGATAQPSTAAPAAGVWSHIAMTVSGTTLTHYLNGSVNGTGTATTPATDSLRRLTIGAADSAINTAANFFKGLLAEAAVYNAALSGTAIAAHFAAR